MNFFVFDRFENIVGEGKNADYQHFFFSNNVFKRPLCQARWKSGLCGIELINETDFPIHKTDSDLHHDTVNPLPHNKILDLSKFKAFADAKINWFKILKIIFFKEKKTLWKEQKNSGYQLENFLPFSSNLKL